MDNSIEFYKEHLNKLKSIKIKFPKINFSDMEKPPRWLVIVIAILIQIVLLFIILWLFDERTIFDNDYIIKKYSYDYLKWGWIHTGTDNTYFSSNCMVFRNYSW